MQKMYTVHDKAAETYLPPFCMKTKAEAVRAFETTVNDPNSNFNKFPQDYSLVEIGTYDEDTGVITTANHSIIAKAQDHIKHPSTTSV